MEILAFVGFVAFIVVVIVLGILQAGKRRKELMGWAMSKNLRFDRAKDRGVENRFPEFKCLRQGSNRYAENVMSGDWKGRSFLGFDFHYETHSTDSKGRRQTHHHHFSAVVIGCEIPLKPLFIRPEGFFDKITEFFGLDDIDFESAEFSRKFYVKAEDRRWAFDVIHPRAMQMLLDMPRFTIQMHGSHVIAYRGARFNVRDFESAAQVATDLLDQMPDYLVKQLRDGG
ncbi:hypothetical protein JW916_13130 [Candidatus Sumerlaeota bacterium]|nr:hypothetical protein [Candidatus Sumerlaeota bacterium]